MNVRFLGAHNIESKDVSPSCILIDDIIAIDAGGLASNMTIDEQLAIKALFVTHHHYDHIKDIPMLAMTFYISKAQLRLYSIRPVYEILQYMFNYPGKFYVDFFNNPLEKPALQFIEIEPLEPYFIEGYNIVAIPVQHSIPSVGYQITAPLGKKLFYTGDTGIGLQECWQHISPDLLVIEVTASNTYNDAARESNHLTPALLKDELLSFRKINGYLPKIVTVHMFPQSPESEQIIAGLREVATELDTRIIPGYEGLEITL